MGRGHKEAAQVYEELRRFSGRLMEGDSQDDMTVTPDWCTPEKYGEKESADVRSAYDMLFRAVMSFRGVTDEPSFEDFAQRCSGLESEPANVMLSSLRSASERMSACNFAMKFAITACTKSAKSRVAKWRASLEYDRTGNYMGRVMKKAASAMDELR